MIHELATPGGDRELGTRAWPFPKEPYHPKVILMDIQGLLNPNP